MCDVLDIFDVSCDWVEIDLLQAQSAFRSIRTKKSTGPDGLPACLYKHCPSELTEAWHPIFNMSLKNHTVPELWKKLKIIPVPKVSCPTENKHFRPISLTSSVMKCLEKIIVNMIKPMISSSLDPLQFAYKAGRSTEDAIISVTHLISKHLEDPKAYARVLFADFSAAFDTVCPKLLVNKLIDLNVNPSVVKWFHSLLTNRPQQVSVIGTFSEVKHCSTGVPQGFVSSPFIFTVYTNECRNDQPNNFVIKFSDDTVILCLLRVDSPSAYHKVIDEFQVWCEKNQLALNVTKTKELVFDPRGVCVNKPIVIGECEIEQVVSYKYLGVILDDQLKWSEHVDSLCGKLAQRLHFLCCLRLFGVSTEIMLIYYNAILGSLISYGMSSWFGALTVQSKSRIEKILKTAMKVIGINNYPSLQSTFEESVIKKTNHILNDPSHILYPEYELLP